MICRRTRWLVPLVFHPVVSTKSSSKSGASDTALRLARFFGTTAEMWTGLQADYDLRLGRYEQAKQIEREVEPLGKLQPALA